MIWDEAEVKLFSGNARIIIIPFWILFVKAKGGTPEHNINTGNKMGRKDHRLVEKRIWWVGRLHGGILGVGLGWDRMTLQDE